MPGGFHPFHVGHLSLYNSARRAFPDADVYVAATDDTSTRPFPFAVKEKLAQLAGVEAGHFVQVKSPFQAVEITSKFDPAKDQLIFVRSKKDQGQPPVPGRVKKDGTPGYLQPLLGAKKLEPFAKHAYMAYLDTIDFTKDLPAWVTEYGTGWNSASKIREVWPKLDDTRKTELVMSLYPRTQSNPKLAATVRKMLDTAIVGEVQENQGFAATFTAEQDGQCAGGDPSGGMMASYQERENQPVAEKKESSKPRDAELVKALQYIKQHYPNYAGDPEMAMAKWMQRSIKHSEVNDKEHEQALQLLNSKIDALAKIVRAQKTQQMEDYIEESRKK